MGKLSSLTKNRSIEIIGAPSDLGANLRGANMGPAAIRIAGLKEKVETLGYEVTDQGDVLVPIRETLPQEDGQLKFLGPISSYCESVSKHVRSALDLGRMPIVLGGDHSVAIGSIGAVSQFFKENNASLGMVWIDAHADINTDKTSASQNIHGMPLAVALGYGHPKLTRIGAPGGATLDPKKVALIGIRNLDKDEKEMVKKCGIRYFSMREIDERGMFAVMNDAIKIAGTGTRGIHVSLDLDGLDPDFAPGVSTPVTGGLSLREAHLAMEMLADQKLVCSLDLVELNPMHDEKHRTAFLAVELIESLLGKSIV